MRTLLLQLVGPMHGWHTSHDAPHSDIEQLYPPKRGIAGLLACALGRPRGSDMSDLWALDTWVRVDQHGWGGKDFHSSRRLDSRGKQITTIDRRPYLYDAKFLAGLTGPDALLAECEAALRAPMWALSLGRRACVPSAPILLGLLDEPVEDVMRSWPWLAAGHWRRWQLAPVATIDLIRAENPADGNSAMIHARPVLIDNPAGRPAGVDWFSLYADQLRGKRASDR